MTSPSTPRHFVIVVSAGRSDVQLVVDGQRREIGKDNAGVMHDELLQKLSEGDAAIVDSPPSKTKGFETKWPSSPFQVCCPKLDSVIDATLKMCGQVGNILAVVVLQTSRTSGPHRNEEPRAVGRVLAQRAADRLWSGKNLCQAALSLRRLPKTPFAGWIDVLTDNEPLEGPSPADNRDYPLSRRAADRIDALLRALAVHCPTAEIAISPKGGPPPFKDVLEASALLRFGPRYSHLLEAPESSPDVVTDAVRALRPAAATLRTRRQALDLIERGDFRGAYSGARHLIEGPVPEQADKPWLENLSAVANWLQGYDVQVPDWFKREIDRVESNNVRAVNRKPACGAGFTRLPPEHHAVLRAAFAVESALRCGWIPEALVHTGAFQDAGLLDALRGWAQGINSQGKSLKPPATANIVQLRERKLLTDKLEHGYYRYDPFNKAAGQWFGVCKRSAWNQFHCKYFVRPTPAVKGKKKRTKRSYSVSDLRNQVVHGGTTSALRGRARDLAVQRGLWTQRGADDVSFLENESVRSCFVEIGIASAATVYQDLIKAMIQEVEQATLT